MDYKIVVVDDEALSLTNARNLLGEENMKVSCLRSGKDLLRFVEKNTPDLILLDILMPDMDGFETYHALREFEDAVGRKHIPVIFLTGENDSETERRGLKAGASDFIRKPFNRDILIRRIHNTITNSKTIETLTEEASVDKLTGFLNKASGTAQVIRLCQDSSGVLMIMDLDSFKLVNDLYGHDMGDRVLQAFADVVRRNIREHDVIARIGGDEFMGFFMNVSDKASVASLSTRLNQQLGLEAARLLGEDNGIPLGISIGAAMVPEHGRDYESLFSLADNSLYAVKQNGKHGFAVYDQSEEDFEPVEGDLSQELLRITKIVEERNDMDEALLLGREAFAIVFRYIMRFYKRYGGKVAKILFALKPQEVISERNCMEAAMKFQEHLQKTLRKSDLVMQNRSNQFFVVLTGRTKAEADAAVERIISSWEEDREHYKMNVEFEFAYTEYVQEGQS